jgi:hypothetical protein
VWHANVQQENIKYLALDGRQRLSTISCLSGNLELRR